MNVVILGATKGMGRALARLMAERNDQLFLLGRNLEDLQATAQDCALRGGLDTPPGTGFCDLADSQSFEEALNKAETNFQGPIHSIVVTAGIFASQEKLELDPQLAERLLTIDFTNTILFCEAARKRLLAQGGGKLCVFSSVAGERGRKPVVIYGASKAGLTHYLEGLDHRYRAEGLQVITVKPGFVRTGMTAGLKAPPFAGEPETVARRVMHAIDQGRPVIYAPFAWGPIMAVIRQLPRFVMRRVGF